MTNPFYFQPNANTANYQFPQQWMMGFPANMPQINVNSVLPYTITPTPMDAYHFASSIAPMDAYGTTNGQVTSAWSDLQRLQGQFNTWLQNFNATFQPRLQAALAAPTPVVAPAGIAPADASYDTSIYGIESMDETENGDGNINEEEAETFTFNGENAGHTDTPLLSGETDAPPFVLADGHPYIDYEKLDQEPIPLKTLVINNPTRGAKGTVKAGDGIDQHIEIHATNADANNPISLTIEADDSDTFDWKGEWHNETDDSGNTVRVSSTGDRVTLVASNVSNGDGDGDSGSTITDVYGNVIDEDGNPVDEDADAVISQEAEELVFENSTASSLAQALKRNFSNYSQHDKEFFALAYALMLKPGYNPDETDISAMTLDELKAQVRTEDMRHAAAFVGDADNPNGNEALGDFMASLASNTEFFPSLTSRLMGDEPVVLTAKDVEEIDFNAIFDKDVNTIKHILRNMDLSGLQQPLIDALAVKMAAAMDNDLSHRVRPSDASKYDLEDANLTGGSNDSDMHHIINIMRDLGVGENLGRVIYVLNGGNRENSNYERDSLTKIADKLLRGELNDGLKWEIMDYYDGQGDEW